MTVGPTIDFEGINEAALSSARSLLPDLIPGGVFRSLEYVVKNPRRNDQKPGSFSINYKKGIWKDFSSGDGGGDLISLYAYVRGCSQGEAAQELADKLGVRLYKPNGAAAPKPNGINGQGNGAAQTAAPRVFPFGNDGPPKNSEEIRRHTYRNSDGIAVQIKIKRTDVPYTQWYRVKGGWQAKKPNDFQPVPYVTMALDPLDPELKNDKIFWPEGEKDVDTLNKLNLPAFTFGGAGDGLPCNIESCLKNRHLVILADNDQPGREHAEKKAARARAAGAASVKIVDFSELPLKADVTDFIEAGGTAEQLNNRASEAPLWTISPGAASEREWPKPKPLPNGLPPVDAFDSNFLPAALAPWVDDIANRLQCPPDYVGVAAITALGSVIGRRIGIKPQTKTDWVEIPNVWGGFIGRPGMLKSPAMGEALKPIHQLEAEAAKKNEIVQQAYVADLNNFKLRQQVKASLAREALKQDPKNPKDSGIDLGDEPTVPVNIRYRTNDSSYESLGELLISNPTGILVERDELISLLRNLDRDEQSVARGFYLSGWSGTQPYTFDRIGRGHRHIEAVCISVLGNTQPARIGEYVRRANLGGAGGDGLIQRFGLLVWPDAPPEWKNVDEYPNSVVRENVWRVFERVSKLNLNVALALGASKGQFDKIPTLRFDDAAHADFLDWRADLEARLRSGEMSPAFEGHLAKYRKLVPALALINHLADAGDGPVSQKSLLRALAFASYLESHARRIYGSASESELAAAKAILKHIRSGDLEDGFTARDIHQRGWAHLTEREHVGAGLDLLVDLDHLAVLAPANKPQGGRPSVTYEINPRGTQ